MPVFTKRLIFAVLRVVVMLPFAPSVYSLCTVGPVCFKYPGSWVCHNLVPIALAAPLVLIFGSITYDEDPPINPWRGIVVTAVAMAVIWWAASYFVRRLRPPPVQPAPPAASGT